MVPYATKVFETYWGNEEDISSDDVLRRIVNDLGLEGNSFFEKIALQSYKDKLRANTDELIDRGGYGSPTLFINASDMYFGNDRLPTVERKLASL